MFTSTQQAIYDAAVLEYAHVQGMSLEDAEKLAQDYVDNNPFALPPADPRASDINEMPWPEEAF